MFQNRLPVRFRRFTREIFFFLFVLSNALSYVLSSKLRTVVFTFILPKYASHISQTFQVRAWAWNVQNRSPVKFGITVDSRYLKFQGTLWDTSRYPYLDISDLQNWGKINRTTTFNKFICNWTLEVRDIVKILWKRGAIISPHFHNIFHLLLDFHV